MPFCRFASLLAVVVPVFIISSSPARAQSEIPGVGSWRLNVAKSKLGSAPAPRSLTSTIEVVGEHARVTGVRISTEGVRSEARYTAKLDGKDYPIVGSNNADTIALKRIDARTIERVDKKAGKIVETSTTVFSADGKTSTTTGKATSLKGDDFVYVVINEKQP